MEAAQAHLSQHLSKYHIVGNHVSRHMCYRTDQGTNTKDQHIVEATATHGQQMRPMGVGRGVNMITCQIVSIDSEVVEYRHI